VEILPPVRPLPRQRLWVHIVLFILTVFSTMLVGGFAFSAGLLSILLAHEFGHYFAAKHYRVPASLPYFIPFPISVFGTLGAVIRMSPSIPHRRALFDIAAAGPLAGLVLAIPLTFWGIGLSTVAPQDALRSGAFTYSEPLLFEGLRWLIMGSLPDNVTIMAHPLAFAGWAGMFVTALNLLPIGQLDGGHVVHSLFGARSRQVAFAMFGGLALYSLIERNGIWIPLLIILALIGIQHPRSHDDGLPIGRVRVYLGILLAIVFVTCFNLDPIQIRP
jgi:membrane-associated protease RseP (regulator of RpoE activity)